MTLTVTPNEDSTLPEGYESAAELARVVWERFRTARSQAVADDATPQVRSGIEQIAAAEIRDLSGVMRQLVELRQSPLEDHRGTIRPSDVAFDRAVELLVDASVTLSVDHSGRVPFGSVSPDFEGGLRIEWVRPDASVHLVLNRDGNDEYIYHEQGEAFGTDDPVTPTRLASWLHILKD